MENHFLLDRSQYKRDLNVIKHYLTDAATYLSKHTGQPYDVCLDYVREATAAGGDMPLTDPDVMVLTRNQYGDRDKEVVKFNDFLRDVEVNDRLIAPTLTAYWNPETVPSISSEFIEVNIERRNVSKHEMFKAKEDGNKPLEEYKKNEQKSFKISNNSLSGAQSSAHTILYNESAHPSLTSTCRTATSYGNANNEKFLYGNRHYWSPEIVKGNITSIINSTDYALLAEAMSRYPIRHPTVEETCACIKYSTDLYWKNEEELQRIFRYVGTLTDVERSAFVYTGDLYHLAMFNDAFVREFLGRLSRKITTPVENPDHWVKAMDADLTALVSLLCAKELVGGSIKALKERNPEGYATVAATAKNVFDVLDEYQYLIKAFWRVNTLPSSVAHIRNSIRRGVITSDTDSTIFTVQNWTKWYVGKIDFSEESHAISYAVVYLATQTIAHILAKVSAGMGVREKHLHTLSMKNEFSFPVFVLTSMAKHYFAYIAAQEGNVFTEMDVEVKGVYLKDSNAPPHIMEEFNRTLRWVMDKVLEGNGINLTELLKKVAQMEHEVNLSVRRGDSFYLAGGQVKERDSYANPASSPYSFYELWQAVFAQKYGEAPPPPFQAVKVSVELNNQTKVREWLEGMNDRELSERMGEWLAVNKKGAITSFLLPRPNIETTGIPEEIIAAMNIRKLIYTTVKPFYILLEALGYYMINDNLTRLISDTIEIEAA